MAQGKSRRVFFSNGTFNRAANGLVLGVDPPRYKAIGRHTAVQDKNGVWFVARRGSLIRPPKPHHDQPLTWTDFKKFRAGK